ncbi:helix-turn-helix transcriptional regulator [Dehalobacter sp. 14DCB1]|uniref:helix-turn-helix transcriptional regulator n=1 Tax=Dehalobacter sp. 14DCB1 TaxID=2070227 RepID=UPI00104AF19D|nr:helix-turn-helix transcriptional regulator [Dehalobacter sp. 14DCB1]TCX48911.1 XRE family transcriptional regulator [Dehalobacter sp. 14DCB1]
MVHNDLDKLGDIIKAARKHKNLTRDQLAERVGITSRYLMAIENENHKPSYNLLFHLVRELGISADTIFFPENIVMNTELEQLTRLLRLCDERDLKIATATVKALLDSK